MPLTRFLAAHCGALALLACLSAGASADIYWSSSADNVIGRANLDGSGVDPNFLVTGSTNQLGQVAVDGSHVYWTTPASGKIGRAALNGTHVEPAFMKVPEPEGIAITSQYIYWSTPGAKRDAGSIGRASITGAAPNPSFITGLESPQMLAVGAGNIYWDSGAEFTGPSNQHIGFALGEATQAGGVVNQSLVAESYGGPSVAGSSVFWANYVPVLEPRLGFETIGRANLDGSAANEDFITLTQPGLEAGASSTAVDASHIYWSAAGRIGRATLSGGEPNLNLITGITPTSVAVSEAAASGGGQRAALSSSASLRASGALALSFSFPAAGSARVSVAFASTALPFGRTSASVAAGVRRVTVHASAAARRQLRRGRRVRLRVTLTFTAAGGASETRSTNLTATVR